MTFYSADTTARSRQLHDTFKEAFAEGGCTLIGGWAVYELTNDNYVEQSRDVDLVFSTKDAFAKFQTTVMPEHGLQWAGTARRPVNSCVLAADEKPRNIMVDVFFLTGSDACTKRFRVEQGLLYKDIDCTGWLSSVEAMLRDKLTTIGMRRGRDFRPKRFKDLVDAWALIFHNNQGALPDDLHDAIPASLRGRVADMMEEQRAYCREAAPHYLPAVDVMTRWLTE